MIRLPLISITLGNTMNCLSPVEHHPLRLPFVISFFSRQRARRNINRSLDIFSWPSSVIVYINTYISFGRPNASHPRDHLPRLLISSSRGPHTWHPDDPLTRDIRLFNVGRTSRRIPGDLNATAAWVRLSVIDQGRDVTAPFARCGPRVLRHPSIRCGRRWHFLHVSAATIWILNDGDRSNTATSTHLWAVLVDLASRDSTRGWRHCLHSRRWRLLAIVISVLIYQDPPWRRRRTPFDPGLLVVRRGR
jgi:hypothetical protein